MSTEERHRAEKYVFENDRRRFVVCRSWLRRLLGSFAGTAAGEIGLSYNAFGKPELAQPSDVSSVGPIRFNVSHSGGVALMAFTCRSRLGVDIERIRTIADADEVAKSCFSSREQREYADLPIDQKTNAFFNGWTRKEAFVKAWGNGLSLPLGDFDVTLKPGAPARLLEVRIPEFTPADWGIFSWEPFAGWLAALVVEHPAARVQFFDAVRAAAR